jgi:hypothetical protein
VNFSVYNYEIIRKFHSNNRRSIDVQSKLRLDVPSHLCIPRTETVIPKQNYNVLSPNSYTHISVIDLHISRIGQPILMQENK